MREREWPKVAIMLLNWNGWQDTLECLESVYQINYPNFDVIVVDNGSEDESILKIKHYCEGAIEPKSEFFCYNKFNKPINILEYTRSEVCKTIAWTRTDLPFNKNLTLIKNEKNFGFAEGNNIAIKYALNVLGSKYILMLNNDTVVDTEFLIELVNVVECDTTIGIIGPIIYHYWSPNKIQSAGVMLCWYTGKAIILRSNEICSDDHNGLVDVDYVTGCALLAKAELINNIGYLNPAYFAYWEETDWCIRAHKAGYRVICDQKSQIWHKGSSTSKKLSGFHAYHITRNKFWFMRQHATSKQYFLFIIYFFGFHFLFTSMIYIMDQRDFGAFISFLRGVKDGTTKYF